MSLIRYSVVLTPQKKISQVKSNIKVSYKENSIMPIMLRLADSFRASQSPLTWLSK